MQIYHIIKQCLSMMWLFPKTADRGDNTYSSVIIRPHANDRTYAFEHLRAFSQSKLMDPIRAELFKRHILQTDSDDDASWEKAKQWWEELYGDTIENFDDTEETIFADDLQQWYRNKICTPKENLTPNEKKAHLFIHYWWNQATQQPSDEIFYKLQHELKKMLICVHPDRQGCNQATIILLEWKKVAENLQKILKHLRKMPIPGIDTKGSFKAKPWHVYGIFSDYMNRVEIQKNKDRLQKLHHERIMIERKNMETIIQQRKIIASLRPNQSIEDLNEENIIG